MKKFTTTIFFLAAMLLFAADVLAQVPQGFNFQAVARDADGELIANTELGVRVSVLQGAEDGTAVYTEIQNPTTSPVGSFQIVIGEGTSEENFSEIDWAADNYYVKLEIDPAGGEEYEELGTTRLLSVPYALLARDVVNGGSGNGTGSGVNFPLELNGSNGNMSITLGTNEGDNNYGFIGLGNANGDTLGQMHVVNLGDTASQARIILRDSFDRFGVISPTQVSVGNRFEEGGLNSRLLPHNLYFFNSSFPSNTPPAWFGTLGGNGFTQLLDYSDTGVYEGGILTGHWAGYPALLMEDENENSGVWLAHDDGGGKLVLHSPNGQGENIQLGGKSWEDPNLPFLVLKGSKDGEGNQSDMVWMDVQKWEDGTELGSITLRGTDGSEFHINSHGMGENGGTNGQTLDSLFFFTEFNDGFQLNSSIYPGFIRHSDSNGNIMSLSRNRLQYSNEGDENVYNWYDKGGMQVAAADYTNGERATGMTPGNFYMDINNNGTFHAPLRMGISNAQEGGRPFISLSSLERLENESGDLFSVGVVQDPNGNDPNGESAELFVWGDTSPNIQMGGQQWENTDHAYLQLFGSTQDGNGWYRNNAFLGVGSDGTDEWASLSLSKTNIVGQTGQETILLDGNSGNINISGTLSQSSDERLKKDIQPLDNALSKTLQLRGVSYSWKSDDLDQAPQIGVIAQELEEVYPEFVSTDEEGMKSVNYAQLTAVLIEAVKELNTEILKLQKENTVLQAKADKQNELEERLAKIEKLLGQKSVNERSDEISAKK